MVITPPYVDNVSADLYIASRWPHTAWDNSSESDKTAALITASNSIDRLNFAGDMASVLIMLAVVGTLASGTTVIPTSGTGVVPNGSLFQLNGDTYSVVSHAETGSNTTSITIASPGLVRSAAPGAAITVYQVRQFPRGTDQVVPQSILMATCELAYAFLDGADPSLEIENANVVSQGLGDVRTTYDRTFGAPHTLAGIPSIQAWHLLLPFLRDPNEIRMIRDSYRLGNPQSFI